MLFILYMVIYIKYLTVNILLTGLLPGSIPVTNGKIIFVTVVSVWKSIFSDLNKRLIFFI